MTNTLLLFDIDGTLLRAENATRRAMNDTFCTLFGAAQGLQDISFISRTDPELFRQAARIMLGRELTNEEYTDFTHEYLLRLWTELRQCPFRVMPGVQALLEDLTWRPDVILGLETGNIREAANLKLLRGSIDRYFICGGFGSDAEAREDIIRAGIARARALDRGVILDDDIYVIGDATHDIEAGKNLGLKTIAVGTGYIAREELMKASPVFYLKDLGDMKQFLRCIGREK